MQPSPSELGPGDRRLLRALRALPDSSLDRARAHLAAGLPLRRAELGWQGRGAADDGCLVGVSMSRLEFLRAPRRLPGLVRLTAVFDSWAFEECQRLGDLGSLRSRQLPDAARRHLAELLDLEHRRRQGWSEAPPASVESETPAPLTR